MTNSIITTAGTATRVADVESGLNTLWVQAAEGDNALLRATTLNLIVYTDSPDRAMTTIAQVPECHPCRTILITLSDQADAPLTATPAILRKPAFGSEMRSQVCGEQITLTVGRNNVDRVPGAVQSLRLADQPTFMVWQGELMPTDPIFQGISNVLNGVIVDSAQFASIEDGLRAMQVLMDMPYFEGYVYDLNWRRLLPWCMAIAQQFDPQAERSALRQITSVEITQRNAHGQVMLLLGWLADRLNWQIAPGTRFGEWHVQSANGAVALRLKDADASTPGLYKVSISTPKQTYLTESMIDDNVLIIHLGGQNAVKAKASLDDGTLLNIALDSTAPDHLYEQALKQAVTFGIGVESIGERTGLIVVEDADALSRMAAREFVQIARNAVKWRGRFAAALSGGSTPKSLFALLAQAPYRDQIPWEQTHLFWGDERDVPTDHPDSNQRMAHETLIDHVPIPAANVHGILTGQLSAADAAGRYADELRTFFDLTGDELPQFDLILLGLGDDGHTASLFPHTQALTAQGTDLFVANPIPQLNTTRLTLTADVINNAANVIFLVAGAKKADILYKVLRGAYQPDDHPSQRIKPTEGTLTFLVDQAAASRLHGRAN